MRQLPQQVQRLVSRYLRIVDAALPGLVGGCTWSVPPPWATKALRCRPVPLRQPDSPDSATARRAEATDFVTFAITPPMTPRPHDQVQYLPHHRAPD